MKTKTKNQHTKTNIARLDQTRQHKKRDLLVTNSYSYERKKNLRRFVSRMNVKETALIFVAPTNERIRKKSATLQATEDERERDRRTHTHTQTIQTDDNMHTNPENTHIFNAKTAARNTVTFK